MYSDITQAPHGHPISRAVERLEMHLPGWWHHIRHEPGWQDGAFIGLASAYALLATIALVQLLRISRRCPQYGWTTQKVFHLLNLLVCALRAVIMLLHTEFASLHSIVARRVLNDLPGLLFFSTYTLLVLFWAEIYQQARSQSTTLLRPCFLYTNISVYAIHLLLLALCGFHATSRVANVASSCFLVAVALVAAAGFVTYGGRLFLMLHRFPIESPGRLKKLREVGTVTAICTVAFVSRATLITLATIDSADFELDLLQHPLLNIFYYSAVEVVPSALVLYILRKLPPKRTPVYTAPDLERQ